VAAVTCSDLVSALGLGPREHIAIVGGGGKTSLMIAMAEALSRGGARVVTTTTTKVWLKQARLAPHVIFRHDHPMWREELGRGLSVSKSVFVAERPLENGKAQGIDPAVCDDLFMSGPADYIIAEADGAAGRPVKAHAPHEPVIPQSSTIVVAMAGLDCLGRPANASTVFRLDHFLRLTGLREGQPLTPACVSRLFGGVAGLFKGTPPVARLVVFLNKLDYLKSDQDAISLGRRILKTSFLPLDRVACGSLREQRYRILGRLS
jgi:probable selenium-dependent hydroxylase accessory protein YqeC